ncbi:hypothetical protein [Frigoriglobus tundricola]|uniref:Uncharacterized protein n=1 Tax=Frigoriglobus tundricola TaxID=2774151 RepID=A0A6M5YMS0_9BACT|nr:hypothetical protein [Frigoriglobus tundricola]QJW94650.1 hypothetical protein FTUN_2172 [Frigoriglobus tundricola]
MRSTQTSRDASCRSISWNRRSKLATPRRSRAPLAADLLREMSAD